MSLVPASTVADLARVSNQNLPERATVKRPSAPTDDGAGGSSSAEAVIATGVPCAVAQVGIRASAFFAGAVVPAGARTVRFALTSPVRVAPGDHLLIAMRTGEDLDLDVVGRLGPRSIQTQERVLCVPHGVAR